MAATDPIPPSRADDYAAARAICRHHAKSFHFASHFLPRPKRDHAYAVYAFCRLLDDAADEEPSIESVERFVALLDEIYEGRAAIDEPALRPSRTLSRPARSRSNTFSTSPTAVGWTSPSRATRRGPTSSDIAIAWPAWSG